MCDRYFLCPKQGEMRVWYLAKSSQEMVLNIGASRCV